MSLLERLLSALPRIGAPQSRSEQRALGRMGEDGSTALLERLLATLEAQVVSFAICEVAPGQALVLPGTDHPVINYVLKGAGKLKIEGNGEADFEPQSFIVLPARQAYRIETMGGPVEEVQGLAAPTTVVDHMLRISSDESQAPEVITACGSITATYRGAVGIFDGLDRPIAIRLEEGDPLRRAFEAMLGEIASPKLGTRSLTEALLKQCLLHLIRRLAFDPLQSGWLFGTSDTRLARAVLAMVESPAREFTLEGLAQIAGMSRSRFAAHFQAAFGTSPIDLLKRIRLRHAAQLLEQTELPIALIAQSIGYESRTYFSRAFRAEFGMDPRSFRKQTRSQR